MQRFVFHRVSDATLERGKLGPLQHRQSLNRDLVVYVWKEFVKMMTLRKRLAMIVPIDLLDIHLRISNSLC